MTSGQDIDGIQRQYCDNCGYIDFIDPKVVAVAIVVNQKRELLLVKRNIEPALGEWAFPSGYVDNGEACLLYTSPSPRDGLLSRMPSSA